MLHERLRVLAIGIRPTFAAACGVAQRGVVDILDAHGITGWQVGLRQLLRDAEAGVPIHHEVLRWMRAELSADLVRWRHLASFMTVLMLAASQQGRDDQSRGRFLVGWQRNLAYALQQLESARLVVSSATVALVGEAAAMFRHTAAACDLVDLLTRLENEAAAHVRPQTVDPPDLVLGDFVPVLRATLAASA